MRKGSKVVLVAGWAVILLCLILCGLAYEKQATRIEMSAVKHWPQASKMNLATEGYTLLMFCHPKCPCSQASLKELARIQARVKRLNSYICFAAPESLREVWTASSNWQLAESLGNTDLYKDLAMSESKLFHARSSGEVFLFNPAGKLLFHGGITAQRGHEGDNSGKETVIRLCTKAPAGAETTGAKTLFELPKKEDGVLAKELPLIYPVFGCLLFDQRDPSLQSSTERRRKEI